MFTAAFFPGDTVFAFGTIAAVFFLYTRRLGSFMAGCTARETVRHRGTTAGGDGGFSYQ